MEQETYSFSSSPCCDVFQNALIMDLISSYLNVQDLKALRSTNPTVLEFATRHLAKQVRLRIPTGNNSNSSPLECISPLLQRSIALHFEERSKLNPDLLTFIDSISLEVRELRISGCSKVKVPIFRNANFSNLTELTVKSNSNLELFGLPQIPTFRLQSLTWSSCYNKNRRFLKGILFSSAKTLTNLELNLCKIPSIEMCKQLKNLTLNLCLGGSEKERRRLFSSLSGVSGNLEFLSVKGVRDWQEPQGQHLVFPKLLRVVDEALQFLPRFGDVSASFPSLKEVIIDRVYKTPQLNTARPIRSVTSLQVNLDCANWDDLNRLYPNVKNLRLISYREYSFKPDSVKPLRAALAGWNLKKLTFEMPNGYIGCLIYIPLKVLNYPGMEQVETVSFQFGKKQGKVVILSNERIKFKISCKELDLKAIWQIERFCRAQKWDFQIARIPQL